MRQRRTTLAWLGAGVLCGACLAGCGDDGPVMPDTSKTVPVVPQRYQRRTLDEWTSLPRDAAPEEKVAQAFALAALETKEPIRAAPILLRLLADDDASVRLAAVIASGRLAPPSPRIAGILTGYLDDEDEPLRRHARKAVGALGEAAVQPLGEAAGLIPGTGEGASVRLRWAVLTALARVGAPAERLADAVQAIATDEQEDATLRRQAALTLAQLGATGATACAGWLTSDASAAMRDQAAAALGHAGADAARVLLPVLAGEDEVGAAVAAGVLEEIALRGSMGDATADAARALASALDREGPVRFNAMDALVAIGAPARAAIEARQAAADAGLQEVLEHLLESMPAK